MAVPVVYATALSDTVEKRLTGVDGIHAIRIDNVNGDCHVRLHDADQVMVRADITVKGVSEEACDEFYRKLAIEVKRESDRVLVQVVYPKTSRSWFGFGKSPHAVVDLVVTIPDNWDVTVDLVNGDIDVERAASCTIDLVNGDVLLQRVDRLNVDLVNGNIQVEDVTRAVSCDVINGNLQAIVTGSAVEKVYADMVNGNIDVTVPAAVIGRLYMESSTGRAVLMEKTAQGEWRTKLKSKRISMKEDGQARIGLETVNGRITVRSLR